mgnify:CR=1 FL=1
MSSPRFSAATIASNTALTASPAAVLLRLPAFAAANDAMEIPLCGKIAAGTPIEALQGTETFSVPAALLGPGEHYALEVSGDSMVEEGILDGDFALIRKVDDARDGEHRPHGRPQPRELPPVADRRSLNAPAGVPYLDFIAPGLLAAAESAT